MSFYSKLSTKNQETYNQTYADAKAIQAKLGMSFFYGGNGGIGKTRSALHYAKKMIEDYQVLEDDQDRIMGFIEFTDFCDIARNSIGNEQENWLNRQKLKDFREIEFLILDDIGTEKQTEFIDAEFFKLVKARYENPTFLTIFTSNSSLEQIKEKYHERAASRITDICGSQNIFYVPNGKDWRKEVKVSKKIDLTEVFSNNQKKVQELAYKPSKIDPVASAVKFLKSIKKINENMYQRIKQGADEKDLEIVAKFAKTTNQSELNNIFNLVESL